MADPNKAYSIVVGVDYSETGELAFKKALELAAEHRPAVVHVVHVMPLDLPALAPELAPSATKPIPSLEKAAERLSSYAEKIVGEFVDKTADPTLAQGLRVVPHLRSAMPSNEVAQLAADLEADLVVVGTHGRRALARLLLGSVAEMTVRLAPCPVLVVRPKARPAPVPAIEPPCPRCVEARTASQGKEFWCEQHRERHGQRHTYHQGDRASAETNMPLFVR